MSRKRVTVSLSEETYADLVEEAEEHHVSPATYAGLCIRRWVLIGRPMDNLSPRQERKYYKALSKVMKFSL